MQHSPHALFISFCFTLITFSEITFSSFCLLVQSLSNVHLDISASSNILVKRAFLVGGEFLAYFPLLYQLMNPILFLVVCSHTQVELGRKQEVVVYDQSSKEAGHLSKDGFVHILMGKLEGTFHKVSLLTGKPCGVDKGCFSFYYTFPAEQQAVHHLSLLLISVLLFVIALFSQQMSLERTTNVHLIRYTGFASFLNRQ